MKRQLIARIEESLHERLKERARAEGRSMNAVVTDLLRTGLNDRRAAFRERLRAEGRLVEPRVTGQGMSREEAIEALRGSGRAVLDALEADRAAR